MEKQFPNIAACATMLERGTWEGLKMDIDLDIALRKLHQLQLEDGDLGAEYWLQISKLLREAASYRERALVAEEKLRRLQTARR